LLMVALALAGIASCTRALSSGTLLRYPGPWTSGEIVWDILTSAGYFLILFLSGEALYPGSIDHSISLHSKDIR
jgi:hypothetical protein